MNLRNNQYVVETPYYILSIVVITIVGFPFYWLFSTSLVPRKFIFTEEVSYIPTRITLENYTRLFEAIEFSRMYINSSIVAAGSILVALIVSSFAGYSFARGEYPGRKTFTLTTVATQMLPRVLILIPLFFILQSIGLINSLFGLMITYLAFALPFTMLILKAYFESLPSSLEEAAMIDGCTRFQAFTKIVLPLSVPGLIAAGTYAFVIVWQELIFALTFAGDPGVRTLPVGLLSLLGQYNQPWEVLFAGGVLATIPPLIIFFALQRYLIQGMTMGATKQ